MSKIRIVSDMSTSFLVDCFLGFLFKADFGRGGGGPQAPRSYLAFLGP